jgi:hemerythrin superfamily protein
MDAIQLLKTDHQKVKELLAELAQTSTRAVKKRSELLAQIRVMLKAHTTIEEEIFYPAF